jgi:hypothetical protein
VVIQEVVTQREKAEEKEKRKKTNLLENRWFIYLFLLLN